MRGSGLRRPMRQTFGHVAHTHRNRVGLERLADRCLGSQVGERGHTAFAAQAIGPEDLVALGGGIIDDARVGDDGAVGHGDSALVGERGTVALAIPHVNRTGGVVLRGNHTKGTVLRTEESG